VEELVKSGEIIKIGEVRTIVGIGIGASWRKKGNC